MLTTATGTCRLCRKPTDAGRVCCYECLRALDENPCRSCGRPLQYGGLCAPCRAQNQAEREKWMIKAYIADRLVFEPHAFVGSRDLLADVNAWLLAERIGVRPVAEKWLALRLEDEELFVQHGVTKARRRLGQRGQSRSAHVGPVSGLRNCRQDLFMAWVGIRFRESGDSDIPQLVAA